MDKREVLVKVIQYADVVNQRLHPKRIILYGSYARGNYREESDIDVAVIVDHIDDDYLELAALLFKLTRDIDMRIEPVLLEDGYDRSGFLEEITKYGEVIFDSCNKVPSKCYI